MKRSAIREAVEVALADNGYSVGFYSWQGAKLRIFDCNKLVSEFAAVLVAEIHLPSGTSQKRLIERLSVLPCAGSPRPRPRPRPRHAKAIQLDIEDAIAAASASKRPSAKRKGYRDIPASVGARA